MIIFNYNYLYSAYAVDTTFFLNDIISVKHIVDTFFFLYSSGLKPNLTKSEIVGIGILKVVQVAVCGMRCIDLNVDTLKILGTHFSYNKKLKEEKKIYKIVTDMKRFLKIWKMRRLTLEGKIVIFKTIAISKIVSQTFITTVPKHIVSELKKIQKAFFWNNSSPKIKHETLCNDYKAGGLKNVDIPSKIIALQCYWIRRLYDNSFYEWKLIPLYLIEKSFGIAFKFHSNLLFKSNKINFFLSFYRQIIFNWKKHLAMITKVPSCMLSQYLWHKRSIQVDNSSVYFLKFSEKNINYVSQLFSDNGSIKQWHEFKREDNLHGSFYFQWLQLIDSIPQRWKIIIKENYENAINLIIDDHHLVKGSRVITLVKLTSTEIYSILISRVQNKPSSNIYFKNLYDDYNIDGTAIYMLPCLITNNTDMRSFQYKILNNVLFLNKKLHTFGIKPSPLCSFCNLYDKTPYHMFYECDHVKCLWSDLLQCFQNNLI